MATSIDKKFLAVVAAVLGALVAYAALAPAAKATEVQPTNQQIKITNKGPTDFIPSNAYENQGIRCFDSQAEFTISDTHDRNINKTGIGTHSTGPGSVITSFDPNSRDPSEVKAPVFRDCHVWDFDSDSSVASATVETNTDHGNWTLAAQYIPGSTMDAILSIGVPAGGAVIDAPFCEITVSNDGREPGAASSVFAEWHNEERENGEANVDGQIDFTSSGFGCSGDTPAQFEGTYQPDVDVTITNGGS